MLRWYLSPSLGRLRTLPLSVNPDHPHGASAPSPLLLRPLRARSLTAATDGVPDLSPLVALARFRSDSIPNRSLPCLHIHFQRPLACPQHVRFKFTLLRAIRFETMPLVPLFLVSSVET